jgi:penicillin-binding protein 2
MQDVIESGTGRVARIEGISVAGKTGTAENYGMIYGKREKLKDHSWFVCFAPRENPKIAVAVIVENAGFGATWAGPMAGLIMEKFLKDTLSSARWKEVERIEQTEIILPIVKMKRTKLDSLRQQKLRKMMSEKATASTLPIKGNEKNIPLKSLVNREVIQRRHEEQLV